MKKLKPVIVSFAMLLGLTAAGCVHADSDVRGFTDFAHIERNIWKVLKSWTGRKALIYRKNWKVKIPAHLFSQAMEIQELPSYGNIHG